MESVIGFVWDMLANCMISLYIRHMAVARGYRKRETLHLHEHAAIGILLCSLGVVACSQDDSTSGDAQLSGDTFRGDDLRRDAAGDSFSRDDYQLASDTAQVGGDASFVPIDLLPPSLSPVMTYCPFTDAQDLTVFEGRPVVRVCHVGDTRAGCDVDTIAAGNL